MERGDRRRLVALAVLLAIAVPLVVIAIATGGDDEPRVASLRIEAAVGGLPEMIVYVDDPELNVPGTAAGERAVVLECLDREGGVVFSSRERWPFTDTDGGIMDPHVHVVVEEEDVMAAIARCRLSGTEPSLEGRKA